MTNYWCDDMEKLSHEQREGIKKMSSAVLAVKLARSGLSDEQLESMDRAALLEAWTKVVSEGREGTKVESVARAKGAVGYDAELERERLSFEIRKFEAEERRRREEMGLERERLDLERARIEKEGKTAEETLQLKHMDFNRMEKRDREERERLNSAVYKAKLFGDALKGTMARMPTNQIDLLPYFRQVEQLFADFKVEKELRAHLLGPHLSEQARSIISRMDSAKANDYDEVKKVLLREFKLSSSALLERFNRLKRESNESFTLYGNRLKSVLMYYTESRGVSDYDTLIDLLVCDRLKSQLSEGSLRYILSIENQQDKGWLELVELVSALDVYCDAHCESDKPRVVSSAVTDVSSRHSTASKFQYTRSSSPKAGAIGQWMHPAPRARNNDRGSDQRKSCYICGSKNHLKNFHDKRSTPNAKVQACFANKSGLGASEISSAPAGTVGEATASVSPVGLPVHEPTPIIASSDVTSDAAKVKELLVDREQTVAVAKIVERDLATLQYIDVCLGDGCNVRRTSALCDSGAELSLCRSDMLQGLEVHKIGSVRLRGVIGQAIDADVIRVSVKLDNAGDDCYVPVTMAMSPMANDPLILSSEVVGKLIGISNNAVISTSADDVDGNYGSNGNTDNDSQSEVGVAGESESPNSVNAEIRGSPRAANTETLHAEQMADPTLKGCRSLAERERGGFFLRRGLLFHRERILGQSFDQLVLPECRRAEVLKLAHDTYGAHMGALNTKQRIRYSFFWPTIARDAKAYVASCSRCARRKRITCYDTTPVTPIPRDEKSFNHWHVDAAGPFFPNQRVDKNYCLIAVDSNSRFPMAFPLRAVTAKSVCDCLLKLWSLFGVSQFVSLDNATCNTAKLTRLLMEKMGCSPIFITPTNSRANGLAERYIGSLKEMIHKMAYDRKRSWHQYLDYILWALREIPQAGTGVSPWMLAFGHVPRGPCAVLKDAWVGEEELPLNLGTSVTEYLIDLRNKLAEVNDFAAAHMQQSQHRWASRYNLRTRPKSFQVDDPVLILAPDDTSSRLWSRWRTGVVVQVKSPFSYIVECDGNRYHVPVSKLRHYDVRCEQVNCNALLLKISCDVDEGMSAVHVNSCTSVIYDQDEDFGKVDGIETDQIREGDVLLPSLRIDPAKISHLNPLQRKQLLEVLDRYPAVFSDKPGFCDMFEMEINVSPEFKPKRLKSYAIPEKLRPEVRRQMKELLDLGLIEESTSPMASPLICVLKGPNGRDGVRCVMDYRYINHYTVGDALAPPDIADILQRIGRARYITSFDGKSSYWTIPIKKEHRWLTGFICEGQLYQWTRAAFGLKNSGCAFVRMLQKVLQPIRSFVENFVDDLATFTDEHWDTHLKHIDLLLQNIKKCGLTLNLKKSSFAMSEVKFCGHIVGSGKRRIDPDKVRAVRELRRPETKSQVRSVLGTFSWFRDYIPGMTELARPLIELTAKRVPNRIPWGELHEHAFIALKRSLCDAANKSLQIIDWSKPFNIYSDASDHSVAGVLSQTDAQGHEKPISFFSRKLSESQKAWPIIEREAYAVLDALNRFRGWIWGYPIHVFCDHNPLSYLTSNTPKNPRLLRWALALQVFGDLSFHYKAGNSAAMVAPDCLSRMGPDEPGTPSAD